MALQTLVENSVKYAVSPRREGGSICVTAAAADGRVRVTVEDDGPGFDAAHRPDGHGLALLDARLAMLFGDRASMRVDSRAGRTGITIDVPTQLTSDNLQVTKR
jgi:LytS/YehU family sensor histidine kinase